MKNIFISLLLFLGPAAFGQRAADFGAIDAEMRDLEAPTPDSLARLIVARYSTEIEKTRAIFSWIAQHVSYNTGYYSRRRLSPRFFEDPADTLSVWPSGIEMTARRVLHRRVAVCEGYARLFKTLCDYAGLQSELVSGYARPGGERPRHFRTNHTWNAVRVDSVWQLVDPTWGSGYVNYADEFVPRIDDAYFLPDPRRYLRDHYPEDLRWALLPDLPEMSEYRHAPYRWRAFVKYSIEEWAPSTGWIEAAPGDTVTVRLRVRNPEKDAKISADDLEESGALQDSVRSVFVAPELRGHEVWYRYVVPETAPQWLHLLYNNDVILRYALRIRPASLPAKEVGATASSPNDQQ